MKSSVVNEKNKVIESLYDGYGKHNTNKQIGSLRKQKNVFDKFVIPLESPWKANFDNLLILASCINVFTQGFYSAFGNPQDTSSIVLEYLTEVLFSLDLIFCFCQEFNDTETYSLISDIKTIAVNYAKGSFFFDLLAILPFHIFLRGTMSSEMYKEKSRLFKLFKLLRVPRLIELLNVDRVKKSVKVYYQKQLESNLEKQKDSENYPILKALMLVYLYKIVRLVLIIFTSSYFLGIFWYIIVYDI